MLTEKQKQYSSLSLTSGKTSRNPLIPFKVTTDDNPKTSTTIFSGRIIISAAKEGPTCFMGYKG